MAKRFFGMRIDVYVPGRWYLDDPQDLSGQEVDDIWAFVQGRPVELRERLRIPIFQPGKPLDIEFAGAGQAPIVSERVAAVFRELAPQDVQLFPVEVEGRTEPYFLLNVAREVRCIDDAACDEARLWTPEDGRPELVGEYHVVSGLRIDVSKVGDARVFRLWGWHPPIIVNEEIKDALERVGHVGALFTAVTGPKEDARDADSRQPPHGNPELLRRVGEAREAAFRAMGELEEESIIPIIPEGETWPSGRQAWRIIHRPGGRTVCVTDGLSDPFLDQKEPSLGYGIELAIETDEPVGDDGGWLLQLLRRVSGEVAEHERLRVALGKGVISMEVPGEGMPESLVTKEGRVGALVGMGASGFPGSFSTPAGAVRLLIVKALSPQELAFLLEHGRKELLQRFARGDDNHLSRVGRKPMV